MKPFDLEKALAGERLVTRNGLEVRGFNRTGLPKGYEPFEADVLTTYGWFKYLFHEGGKYFRKTEHQLDLFMAE